MNYDELTFGELVRHCRKSNGYTQQQLADLAKVHHTYISHIENDALRIHTPSEDTVRRMADAFGVDHEWFLSRAGVIDTDRLQHLAQTNPTAARILRAIQNGEYTPERIERAIEFFDTI